MSFSLWISVWHRQHTPKRWSMSVGPPLLHHHTWWMCWLVSPVRWGTSHRTWLREKTSCSLGGGGVLVGASDVEGVAVGVFDDQPPGGVASQAAGHVGWEWGAAVDPRPACIAQAEASHRLRRRTIICTGRAVAVG